MGFLLVVQIWKPLLTTREVDFNSSPYWVQFHGVPLEGMRRNNVQNIGARVGDVIAFEDPKVEGGGIARGFIRAKVILDVHNLLVASFWVPRLNLPLI